MKELLKLHMGCGKRYIPGFVHIDQVSFDHIDYKQDIRKLNNFCSNTVSLIYACQVIEYFDREEVVEILQEWLRVLQPNGTLRLSVPNFEVITRLYCAGLSLEWFLGTLYGKIPDGKGGYVYHKTTYDQKSLASVFDRAGFINAREWDWRETEHSHVDDFSQAYFPHMEKERGILFNLNMEATKPTD
ncbi:MAG: methyltransferase domain-containing protein [Hyphomicrobiales bacterium]|nr:methyltransferase domain-containing protein [Hyphomicrobiales bacterium]